MSMFQIITQEGWTDVVVEILRATNDSMVPFVAIYFVGYHLLVTLVGTSTFYGKPSPAMGDRCIPISDRA